MVDQATRCVHYHLPLDIVALKIKCCGRYFPCHRCHGTDHELVPWSQGDLDAGELVVLCGECRQEMTFEQYRQNSCIRCHAPFNPKCAQHYHIYFTLLPQAG